MVTKSPKCLIRRIASADRLVIAVHLIGSSRRRQARLFPLHGSSGWGFMDLQAGDGNRFA
jgi:hypothetical protein